MQPDYTRLFSMEDPMSPRPLRLGPEDARYEGQEASMWAHRLFLGEERPAPPLRLVGMMGGKAVDMIWATIQCIVISQRLVDVMTTERFTGWDTCEVDVYDRQRQRLTGYYGLAITGRAGDQDLMRGDVVDKPPPAPRGRSYQVLRGLYFQNDAWDGSDFSTVDRTAKLVASARVVDAFKRARIGNVRFVRLDEYEQAVSDFRQFGLWPAERQT